AAAIAFLSASNFTVRTMDLSESESGALKRDGFAPDICELTAVGRIKASFSPASSNSDLLRLNAGSSPPPMRYRLTKSSSSGRFPGQWYDSQASSTAGENARGERPKRLARRCM